MKKHLWIAVAAVLALAACTKENPAPETGIDASKVVFNITVNRLDAPSTKGIKTDWETGDVVYLFFENNKTAYVKLTFNGSGWASSDQDGGSSYTGLELAASGKKLTAVYLPYEPPTPEYVEDEESGWRFSGATAFILTDESVPYTVDTDDVPATLTATLNLTVPQWGIVQFFVPDEAPVAGKMAMTESHFQPMDFYSIYPGGEVTYSPFGMGKAIQAIPATVNGDAGYYFYGFLQYEVWDTPTTYSFQLVQQEPGKGYAVKVWTKEIPDVTLYTLTDGVVTNAAVKFNLESWEESAFVDLGVDVKWAVGNLTDASPYIADPLEAGNYYMWGYTTPYNSSNPENTESYNENVDAAHAVNDNWRMPSSEEFYGDNGLLSNTSLTWKTGWTTLGGSNAGALLTSHKNGLSIFLPAAGWQTSEIIALGSQGDYWTSTKSGRNPVSYRFDSGWSSVIASGKVGKSIRPVCE